MTTISAGYSYPNQTNPYDRKSPPQQVNTEEQCLGAAAPHYLCAKMPTPQQTKKVANKFMEWLVNYTKKPHRGTDIDSINKKIDYVTDIINGKPQPAPATDKKLYA